MKNWHPHSTNTEEDGRALYCNDIRTAFNLPEPPPAKVNDWVHIYTDGSAVALGPRRRNKYGGLGFWNACTVSRIAADIEICGKVTTAQTAGEYLGAEVASNNTAEITALIESLIWIEQVISKHTHSDSGFAIFSDSRYVVGMLTGKFNPKENILIAVLAKHLWMRVKTKLAASIFWVVYGR